MINPERKPIFRLRLRSLLAITFGVSLVMGVASPLFRGFSSDQYQVLLVAFLIFLVGLCCGVFYSIRSRAAALREAGNLLLAIPLSSDFGMQFARWSTVLLTAPMLLWCSYMTLENVNSPSGNAFLSILNILFSIYYGWLVGEQFTNTWAEGFGYSIELCENGIVIINKFHGWSSPTIKNLSTRKLKMEFAIQLKHRYGLTLKVNEEQYEGVKKILSARYHPPKDPSPFD